MPPQQDQAVCVRLWDWSETSQTLSLFTRQNGLVRAIAKGSKRANAAPTFSGGVELLTRAEATLHIKPAADLALLTAWDLEEVFPRLRKSLEHQHAALLCAEVLQALVADRDPHPDLFDSLLTVLRALGTNADAVTLGPPSPVAPALATFLWELLTNLGYQPVIDRLVPCGAPLPDSAAALQFDPALGGFSGDAAETGGDPAWRVRRATVDALRSLESPADHPAPVEALTRAARFLATYARFVGGTDLRTLPLVFPDPLPAPPGNRAG